MLQFKDDQTLQVYCSLVANHGRVRSRCLAAQEDDDYIVVLSPPQQSNTNIQRRLVKRLFLLFV